MKRIHRLVATFLSRRSGRVGFSAAVALFLSSLSAPAQSVPTPPGPYVALEGQAAFGASEFDAGFVPTLAPPFGYVAKLDDGDGWGGAVTLGYVWRNGWSAAIRYRRLETDDATGRYDPGLIPFGAGVTPPPGGQVVGALDARATVDTATSVLDIEVGNEIPFAGGFLRFFGGLTYAEITRDAAIIDDSCPCAPFAFLLGNDFEGLGPKIGFRGGVPLNAAISLVGGASAAALFGTSKFASRLDDPLSPPFPFKASDRRTVAALNAEAGLAVAVGAGSLTIGYRVDAILGALDTDQRVSAFFQDSGFPALGDRRDDFVAHGPFARFTLSLAGLSD